MMNSRRAFQKRIRSEAQKYFRREIMADDTVKLKCANCGAITELPEMPKLFICKSCGAPNNPQPETAGSGDQACGCILPTGFEWKEPAGCIGEGDNVMYIDPAHGIALTRIEWINTYMNDPKPQLEKMRERGKQGVPGYFNTSTLGKGQK